MRDFMKKEVVFYNVFNRLESVFVPSLETKVTLLVILEKLFSTIGLLIIYQIIGFSSVYEVLPKISENVNIRHKPLALQTCATRCLLLYLSTVSQPTCVFISAHVSEFGCFLYTVFMCVNIEMADDKEQRISVKFCFKLNKTAAETHQILKEAFGEQALSQARTFEWFKCFKDGRVSVEGRKHSGRLSTCRTLEMIAKVREVILEDRQQTIHDVCNGVGLSYGSCQHIVAGELNMRWIAAKFVSS